MRKRIAKRPVDAIRATSRPVFMWDTDVTGFDCKATPTGRKVFLFQGSGPTHRLSAQDRSSPLAYDIRADDDVAASSEVPISRRLLSAALHQVLEFLESVQG